MFWIGRITGVVIGSAGGLTGAVTGLVVGTLIDRVMRDALTIEDVRRVLERYRISSDRSLLFAMALLPAGILSLGRRSGLASLGSADLQRCLNWSRHQLGGYIRASRVDRHSEEVVRDLCADHMRPLDPDALMAALELALKSRGVSGDELSEWAVSALNLVQQLGADFVGIGKFSDALEAWGIDKEEMRIRLRSQVLLDA